MQRLVINHAHGSDTRNSLNANFEYLFEGVAIMNQLSAKADDVLREAQRINRNNIDAMKRLDNIIADSGTSSTEVIDARGDDTVLGARLNRHEKNINYLVERPKLNNGEVILPSDFPEIPFNIYRKDRFNYTHDATAYNQFDWSQATEIFLTDSRVTNFDGLSIHEATDLYAFRMNFQNGVYGNQDSFIFTLVDNIYSGNEPFSDLGLKNVLVRSKSPQGRTIISFAKRTGRDTTEWERHNSIYKLTITNRPDHAIVDVFNAKNHDGFGLPNVYVSKNSISQVSAEKGTFYKDGDTVYCNPHKMERIDDLVVSTRMNYFPARTEHETVMFEDIVFLNDTTQFNYVDGIEALYFFRCGFLRGYGGDAFNMRGGLYNVYLLDCVSAYGTKDGYNYATTSSDSLAVEVNCKSYGNGLFKRAGNTTTHSNNGSTAHNGMNMLRVGSHYWNTEGPSVADVNDCFSISLGTKVGDLLDSNTGHPDAFHLSSEFNQSVKPKFVIECESYGKNIMNGINAPQGNAYYMDFTGHNTIIGADSLESWEG